MSNILKITNVRSTDENGEELVDKMGRKYKVLTFVPDEQDGILSTARPHSRTVFDDAEGFPGDRLFHTAEKGARVRASIETVETQPYYIPSENGRFEDPKTGRKANKATKKTYVVFEDETARSLAESDRNVQLPGTSEEEEQTTQVPSAISDELEEEAEDIAIG